MKTKTLFPLIFLLSFTIQGHFSLASPEVQWFWGLQGDRLVAFNTEGEVNTLIANGVEKMETGHQLGPEQALAFFIVNGHSELYWLTTTEAKLLQYDHQNALPQTELSWTADYREHYVVVVLNVRTIHGFGLVINLQTGTIDRLSGYLAAYGAPVISADGQQIRYISSESDTGPCAMHERDLETGEDQVLYSEILGRWRNLQIIYYDQHGERWIIPDADGSLVLLYTVAGTKEVLAGPGQETGREIRFSDDDLFVSIQKNCDRGCEIAVGTNLDDPSAKFFAPRTEEPYG